MSDVADSPMLVFRGHLVWVWLLLFGSFFDYRIAILRGNAASLLGTNNAHRWEGILPELCCIFLYLLSYIFKQAITIRLLMSPLMGHRIYGLYIKRMGNIPRAQWLVGLLRNFSTAIAYTS
jgi:hypothetical protein